MLPLLPVPPVRLPEWSTEVQAAWGARADQATALLRGAGTGRNFDHLVDEARHVLRAGDQAALAARLGERRFVRALITAWAVDDALARATMTPELIALMAERARMSRLTTIVLAGFFLEHFDRLNRWRDGLFFAVRGLLWRAVASQRPGRNGDVVDAFRQHHQLLLEADGPVRLVGLLLASGGDVTTWFRQARLTAYSDSRFGRRVRDAFYLAAIDAADPERDGYAFLVDVTTEVRTRERSDAPEEDRFLFGHEVLAALTRKSTRHPSAEWLDAVLEIGGDPRLAQTPKWQMWWKRVPDENRARAVRWMRGVDLRAFLDGIEAYANGTHNTDMQRMLDRRKRFLLGLYEQDRVEDVRLILGDDIRLWIRRSAKVDLVDVAYLRISGRADTAIIYVDCGDFSLVEGSHSFPLHVFVGGPLERLADRKALSFDASEIREAVPATHVASYGPESYLNVWHRGFEWIRTALDFLRDSGVTIDERSLMTAVDFADLSRRRANR